MGWLSFRVSVEPFVQFTRVLSNHEREPFDKLRVNGRIWERPYEKMLARVTVKPSRTVDVAVSSSV